MQRPRPRRAAERGPVMWMWVWIIGFLALVVLAAKMMDRRRGSTGVSRANDLPGASGRPGRIDSSQAGPPTNNW
jgi:hypothetical protein